MVRVVQIYAYGALIAAALGCAVLGCGGGQTSATEHGLVGAMERVDKPELVPLRAGAKVYRSDAIDRRQRVALNDSLQMQIVTSLRRKAKSSTIELVVDERLNQVAADLARALDAKEQPHSEAIRFLLAHYGVIEPYPSFHVIRIHRDADKAKLAHQIGQKSSLPVNSPLVTLGVGITRATTTMTIVVIAQGKHIDLEPVTRKHGAGAKVELRGTLLGEFRAPTVHVTNPNGTVDQYRLLVTDKAFRTQVACDGGNGEYQLEVFAEDVAGPRVLANFPIYCGTEPPASLARRGGYVPKHISASAGEAALLVSINRSRKAAGLSALTIDAELSAVARKHSIDMLTNGYFAHLSPRTGSPSDRVKAAGVATPDLLLENIGKGSAIDQIHGGLMRSPGHRSAILHRSVTRVGIGVAATKPGDSGVTVIATELFR